MAERVIAGRYRLLRTLGHGGMSEVWEAEDAELGRRVAVKLLAPDADPVRFEREARAAAALAHPNVVQVYDFGESDEGPYMVLELLPGGSLEERLRPGEPMPDEETARIASALAAGLAQAHDRGLVHRDLKPANVLFDADGRPTIADFGIARLGRAGTITEAGTVLGTAATIAPEQAVGEPATAASDVYSFGVILYRLLTGRFPFDDADPMRLAAMHVTDEPTPIRELRPDAPARLESVATAALAKDPAQRPPDGAALVAELAGPRAVTAVAGAPPTRRRIPLWTAVAAGLLALAAAGVGLAILASDDPAAPAAGTTAPATSTAAPATTADETPVDPAPTTTAPETDTSAPAETTTEPPPETTATTTEEPPPVTEPPILTDTVGTTVTVP